MFITSKSKNDLVVFRYQLIHFDGPIQTRSQRMEARQEGAVGCSEKGFHG